MSMLRVSQAQCRLPCLVCILFLNGDLADDIGSAADGHSWEAIRLTTPSCRLVVRL